MKRVWTGLSGHVAVLLLATISMCAAAAMTADASSAYSSNQEVRQHYVEALGLKAAGLEQQEAPCCP
jgi:hypothetical protein